MDASEFDKFADEYSKIHRKNVAISGEPPEYFAKYKIDELRRRWTSRGLKEPRTILDFGSGVGSSIPHLAQAFPAARICALDVSARSLEIGAKRFGDLAEFQRYDGKNIDLPAGSIDLIFSSCVFHHIDEDQHIAIMSQLRNLLSDDGVLVTFEHNPINPVTRYIVATCEFDENAVLIGAHEFKSRQMKAGFKKVDIAYVGFFPASLKFLRFLDPGLSNIPLGAQYYTAATR